MNEENSACAMSNFLAFSTSIANVWVLILRIRHVSVGFLDS